jgi:cobalt-zinc-cadmium efflux system outer membrane protein
MDDLPEQPPAPSTPSSPAAITAEDALARALERSPELASFSWEVRAREGNALQAGLLPNPEMEAELEEFGGSGALSGFGASETTFLVSQRIETAGKRPKRRRVADIDVEVAGWEYEAARLKVFAGVSKAFAGVLAGQDRVTVSEELVGVSEASLESVRRLVAAGATPTVERTRASVEVATARVELATARRALEAARAELAATWGGQAADFMRAEGDLGQAVPPPPLETVRAWLGRNPELARWDREVARRLAVVELEDARRLPDVTAVAGFKYLAEPNDAALVAGFSVPIPVFDRNQGTRAAARSGLHRARHERRAAAARLAAELEATSQELAARHHEVSELGERILPTAQEAYEGVRRGYLQGLFRNVDVLDAQRTLFELRLRELDALLAYHGAKAEVERLTGTPFAPSRTAP